MIDRLNSLESQIENSISVYEEKLNYSPFHFTSINRPQIDQSYIYQPLTDHGIDNQIYYKEAIIQRDQYILLYEFYKDKVNMLTEYLYKLRSDLLGTELDLYNINDSKTQTLYYENLQNLLIENLSLNNKEKHIRTIKDSENKVIYIDWISIEDSIFHTRFYDYFKDGLVAATRERENGNLIKDIIYGENKYSKKFFDYIYKINFNMANYNHYTEVFYSKHQDIEKLNFYTLNNKLLGSIIYTYDSNKRLVDEVWLDHRIMLRHFTCSYELGKGKYRVTEKDSSGNIIFQDIVNSLDEEKFIKRK